MPNIVLAIFSSYMETVIMIGKIRKIKVKNGHLLLERFQKKKIGQSFRYKNFVCGQSHDYFPK